MKQHRGSIRLHIVDRAERLYEWVISCSCGTWEYCDKGPEDEPILPDGWEMHDFPICPHHVPKEVSAC
jgi:hypothetical protein